MKYPPTQTTLEWGPVVIPFALLLIWLFNLYKLGKLNKMQYILIVCAAVLVFTAIVIVYIIK